MSEWQPISTAKGNHGHDDEIDAVLLSDGDLIEIGWVLRRENGTKKGIVSGFHGHEWTHWMPLPTPPEAS